MNPNEQDAKTGALWESAPKMTEKPPFSASGREIAAAVFSYIPAYLYVYLANTSGTEFRIWMLVFTTMFCGLTEFLHRDTRPSTESWFWLGCLLVTLGCIALNRCQAWGDWSLLLLHGFAVYWVMARGNRLCRGKSSVYLPLDTLHALIRFPFGSFALRVRCLCHAVTRKGRSRSAETSDPLKPVGVVAAVAVAAVLFVVAVQLLAGADSGFARLLKRFFSLFTFQGWAEFWIRLIFSIPVGMYLFGLIAGSRRTGPDTLAQRADKLNRGVAALRRVPALAWTWLLAAFCLLYLLFFVLQGSYLFGAFARTLPEDFTVAEYARQGFFELCRVMGLNFCLVWLAEYSGDAPLRQRKPLKLITTALLAESVLFAVTAFSKLALYISCFSFTPRRLQSAWLICVLCAGSLLSLYHIWTERPAFRKWLLFSAATCALLCIY